MRGRKKTPDIIKRVKGTDQKIRLSGDSEKIEPVTKLPPCPKWMNKHAKKIYRSLGLNLLAVGLLNEANVGSFAVLCAEFGKYIDMNNDLIEEGYTVTVFTKHGSYEMANPKIKIANDAQKNLKTMMVEFGLTPASFTKIASLVKKPEKKNDYESFLNG